MSKEKLKVYIETSVISGYGRQRFHDTLIQFFKLILANKIIPIISTHTLDELLHKNTPSFVIDNLNTIEYTVCEVTDEMYKLTDKYMENGVIVESYRADALHIAIATVLNADVLVSWNMTHIVNNNTIAMIRNINIKEGYHPLQIKLPEEILPYG